MTPPRVSILLPGRNEEQRLPDALASHPVGAGIEGKAWRRILLAEGISVRRWVEVNPRKLGQVIHGAPVVGTSTPSPRATAAP